jgi:tRNA(Ile)-lysidine synthase
VKFSVRSAVAKAVTKAVTLVEAAAVFSQFFRSDESVLVAVSGGPDSMALLSLLVEWGQARLHAVTVNHGLRVESQSEAEEVASTCRQLGVKHTSLTWIGVKPGSGLQQAARAARYALLCDFVREHSLSCMTTAHHADDQAETVLMRLTSGSGLAGLAGMQIDSLRYETLLTSDTRPVRHVRPLLAFSKASLLNICSARRINFVSDRSNTDVRFERVRVRRIMDNLAVDGLSQARLLRLAERAALADEALDASVDMFLSNHPVVFQGKAAKLDWSQLAEEPKAIRQRVLPKILALLSSGEFVEKLERSEALSDEIDRAFTAGKNLRRSIGHWLVSLSQSGALLIQLAPLRRRGTNAKAAVRHKN